MLFTSLEFLLMFLPITVLAHTALPKKARNPFLLLASLFFYAWGEPSFVLVMMGSILVNYLFGLYLSARPGQRGPLCLIVCLNLALLFVFKYLTFTLRNLRLLFPALGADLPRLALPLGISFFTFQAISYQVDVYRGGKAAADPLEMGLYIALFPQLIAGPIVRYPDIRERLEARQITLEGLRGGFLRFMEGFCKKVLLANVLARTADAAFSGDLGTVCGAWLGAVCYALQLYFDFSGYSDMAIGLGSMLGFPFPENFRTPYLSVTLSEFWRRWHITLGSWFRDYVYIPLGGSRGGGGRTVRNLMIVWLLTGLWHGAEWTFVVWGLMNGLLIVAEKGLRLSERRASLPRPVRTLQRGGVLLAVLLGWVVFRSASVGEALLYTRRMLGLAGEPLWDPAFLFHLRQAAVFMAAGLLMAFAVPERLLKRLGSGTLREGLRCAGQVLRVVLFLWAFTFLVMNAHDPFIYFNF